MGAFVEHTYPSIRLSIAELSVPFRSSGVVRLPQQLASRGYVTRRPGEVLAKRYLVHRAGKWRVVLDALVAQAHSRPDFEPTSHLSLPDQPPPARESSPRDHSPEVSLPSVPTPEGDPSADMEAEEEDAEAPVALPESGEVDLSPLEYPTVTPEDDASVGTEPDPLPSEESAAKLFPKVGEDALVGSEKGVDQPLAAEDFGAEPLAGGNPFEEVLVSIEEDPNQSEVGVEADTLAEKPNDESEAVKLEDEAKLPLKPTFATVVVFGMQPSGVIGRPSSSPLLAPPVRRHRTVPHSGSRKRTSCPAVRAPVPDRPKRSTAGKMPAYLAMDMGLCADPVEGTERDRRRGAELDKTDHSAGESSSGSLEGSHGDGSPAWGGREPPTPEQSPGSWALVCVCDCVGVGSSGPFFVLVTTQAGQDHPLSICNWFGN